MTKFQPNKLGPTKPPKGGFVYHPPETFPGDVAVHEQYREAKDDLIDRVMLKSRKYQEQQWRALQIGAHPEVLRFTRLFVAYMANLGVPVFPSEIVRSAERQNQLYKDGFSKAPAGKGPHVFGLAVDLVHSVHGWNMSPKQWEFFGHVGKTIVTTRTCAMTWGGDWPPIKERVGWDPAHWQLREWKQQMSAFPWMPTNVEGKYLGTS